MINPFPAVVKSINRSKEFNHPPMTDETKDYPRPIEDYALIGDCVTAALVARNGSIDWLCWPRFDSDACLAALLGDENNGRWSIAPAEPVIRIERAYRDDTMVLETVFETKSGTVALIDFMPMSHGQAMVSARTAIVRMVEGRRGTVPMQLHLALRFDFGSSVPWVTKLDDGLGINAVAGPNRVVLRSPVETHGEDMATTADFTVSEGQSLPFVLSYGRSHRPVPQAARPAAGARDDRGVLARMVARNASIAAAGASR